MINQLIANDVIFKWLIGFVFAVTLLIIARIFNLDIWFYYNVWIDKLFPILYKRQKNQPKFQRIADIKDSFENKYPVFIKRGHLMRKRYWPKWAFSIVVIFNPKSIVQKIKARDGSKKWTLSVDLRNESYGIYNNAGKKFLFHHFGKSITSDELIKQSLSFHKATLPFAQTGSTLTWGEFGRSIPLRWASGGFLPIIYHRNKYWALLFFRDLPPIGLNVANGATENKNEYKDLHRLIAREFSEETILLSSRPSPGCDVTKKTFGVHTFDPNASSPLAQFLHEEFDEKHTELRYIHDGFKLVSSHTKHEYREIKPIETPFSVEVIHHKYKNQTSEKKIVNNVIYSINPAEFGIEVIWIGTFRLEDDEYIIDGEYDLSRETLIRRPVVLLDMDFLQQIYVKENSLGEILTSETHLESKRLPPIPKNHCIVFDADIELRKLRLEKISELLKSGISNRQRQNLEWEKTLIQKWLATYEKAFLDVCTNGIQDEILRTLCPVSWKTLELIFAHKLNYHLFTRQNDFYHHEEEVEQKGDLKNKEESIDNMAISILFLSADPTNDSRLRLGEEFREIQEKLQLAKLRERFKLHQRMSTRPADFSQALLDIRPQIIHFSGHGMHTGALCFENQIGLAQPIEPDALAALFEQFSTQVNCVVLNACYSETQAKAIAKHINFVIGMSQGIEDSSAIAFSIGFYQALGGGCSIEEAYKLGCVQIGLQGIPEQFIPLLIQNHG